MRKPILAALLFSVLAMSTLPTARASGENYRYFVYAANYNDNNVSAYSANADTGVLTQLPGSPYAAGQYPASVTATADGECIYVTNQGDGTVSAYAVDQESGALTEIAGSPFESGNWPTALASDTGGAFLYVANSLVGNLKNVRGYTIDSSTGALAAVAGNPFDSGDNTMGIAVVRVAAGPPACDIVGGMQYETLDAAIADVPASTPTTIRLLQTIERTSMLAIDGARRITLDLNGYNLNINVAAAETGVAAETSGLVFVTGDVQGKYYGIAVSRGAEVFVHGDAIAVLYGGAGVNAYSVGKATIDGTIQADRAMVFGESDGALVTPTTKPGYLTYSDGQGSFIWVYAPDAVPFITLTTEKAPGSAIYFTSITAAEADLPGVWIDLNDNGVKDDGEELGSPKTVSSPTIRIYGKVTGLNCQLTGLTALDASHNPYLVELECSHNSLTSLDFSQNRKLEYLKCWSSIEGKRLESLNVSHNTELTYLDIWKNALEALDLSNNTKLKRLFCLFSELTELDLSQNAELEFLNCSGGKLVSLTLNNPKLKSLYCDRNQLAALDVSGSPELTVLSCRDNGAIASLNVSHLTKLDDFFCDDNALTSLTLPATSTLRRVTAENNRLTALDASGSTGLTYLRIHGNKLAGDAMTAFVNGLPDVAGSNLYIVDLTLSPPDGNVATKSQVAVAKGKGWNVFDFNNWDPVPYDGSESETPIEVRVLKPTAGVVWTGEQTIEWEAAALDHEASELKITLEYALQSEGSAWQIVAANQMNTGKYKWDTSQVGRGGRYKVRATAADSDGGTAGATSEEFTIVVLAHAVVAAPNPARDSVTFFYDIPTDGTLHVCDVAGRLVYSTLLPASMHAYEWNLHAGGRPLANGVYLYIVVNDAQKSEVGRLVVSR